MGLPAKSQVIFDIGHGYDFEFDGKQMGYVRNGVWIQYKFDLGFVVNVVTLVFDCITTKTFVNLDREGSLLVGPDITFFKEGKFIKKETL